MLGAGQSEVITFTIRTSDLALTDWSGKRAAYKGHYELQFTIGAGVAASQSLSLAATTVIDQMPAPHYP